MTDLVFTIDGIDVDVTIGRFGVCHGASRQVPGLRVVEPRIEHMPRAVRAAIMELKAGKAANRRK